MWLDHVPSDLLALLGLATLVSAWLAALWAFATFMMFATVFAVMLYDVEPPRPLIAFVGQAAGACGVLGFLLVKLSVGGGMLVAAGVGAIVCLVLLRREATTRTAFASAVALFSMLVGGAAVDRGRGGTWSREA